MITCIQNLNLNCALASEFHWIKNFWYVVEPNKRASLHMHVRNEVTLVWGSLKFAPINVMSTRLYGLTFGWKNVHQLCACINYSYLKCFYNQFHTVFSWISLTFCFMCMHINSQVSKAPLSTRQLNPVAAPAARNSTVAWVPFTTKPALMRFTLQVVGAAGTYIFQNISTSSSSVVAVTCKLWCPEGTFWNVVVLPGGPRSSHHDSW